jgi:hypothetical protein
VERFKHLLLPGVYFYSAVPDEVASVRANLSSFLQDQGVAFFAYLAQTPGTYPVYRFRNAGVAGANFYTISEAEKASVLVNVPTYPYEGIGFYGMMPTH